jgi:hypothetical protein
MAFRIFAIRRNSKSSPVNLRPIKSAVINAPLIPLIIHYHYIEASIPKSNLLIRAKTGQLAHPCKAGHVL